MCGIVGLFIKDPSLRSSLGTLLTEMLVTMSERGPDSSGVAIYSNGNDKFKKITLRSNSPESDFEALVNRINQKLDTSVKLDLNDTHAVLMVPSGDMHNVLILLKTIAPSFSIMSLGNSIEIYKETGLPAEVAHRFSLRTKEGTHGIGHTRMATESAVNTMGAHPYSTGLDQCLVHNGSLSNHNNLRRELTRNGVNLNTDNDSEVAAAYLTHQMKLGASLESALNNALKDLDGFYTFVVGTRDGFAVLRDPIACKPAVMAETEQFVAFGSEYRALVNLPGIDNARVWEPEPATVYFWSH